MTGTLSHIVCIDDEEDILEVAQLCLEHLGGFRVTGFSNGRDAADKVAAAAPDLVLLDVMMPGMDGPETLRHLRGQPALDRVPIVFMTARVQQAEVMEYRALGANGVIPKPFDPEKIAEQVTRIWREFHGEQIR